MSPPTDDARRLRALAWAWLIGAPLVVAWLIVHYQGTPPP